MNCADFETDTDSVYFWNRKSEVITVMRTRFSHLFRFMSKKRQGAKGHSCVYVCVNKAWLITSVWLLVNNRFPQLNSKTPAQTNKQKINIGMPNLSYHENHFETELHDNLIKQIVLFQAQFAMNADYFQEQSVTCTAYVMNSPLFTSFPALFMWRKHSIYFPQ